MNTKAYNSWIHLIAIKYISVSLSLFVSILSLSLSLHLFISLSGDSVAQVVGRRTQDEAVLSSNPDTGLISKGCGESLK